jgi:hypothetical protein
MVTLMSEFNPDVTQRRAALVRRALTQRRSRRSVSIDSRTHAL